MARGMRGPREDELTLILDVGESLSLMTCLDEAITSLERIESADIPGVYRETLSRIRETLQRAHAERARAKPEKGPGV